jgi:hypothetical protein
MTMTKNCIVFCRVGQTVEISIEKQSFYKSFQGYKKIFLNLTRNKILKSAQNFRECISSTKRT